MRLTETEFELPAAPGGGNLLEHVREALKFRRAKDGMPVRFAITGTDSGRLHCELAALETLASGSDKQDWSILDFRRRPVERTDRFNAAMVVPTGIGAEIGGHAGDATPAARLLGAACDTLITHPNVVNASDINEMPGNALYVEGSVIARLLMGTVGLQPVRSNRLLMIVDSREPEMFVNAAINSINAARASYGLNCTKIVKLDPPLEMTAGYASSGRAMGEVRGLERVCAALDEHRGEFDAVGISSVISVPESAHTEYYERGGEMVNPWGGVEAMLTHSLSLLYDVPTAHAPMFEKPEIANLDLGVVDPRMAAEVVSVSFLQCILKGLHRSPKIVSDPDTVWQQGIVSAADVSCLVIPDGCLGLPTIAALEQGIPVIAVKGNTNLMRNDLTQLPWRSGQFHMVENYLEAAGLMTAMKAGIAPDSVTRPITSVEIERTSDAKDVGVASG